MEGQRESFLLRTKQLSRLIGDDTGKEEITGAWSALGQRKRRLSVCSAVPEKEALSLGSVGTAFSREVLRAGGLQPLLRWDPPCSACSRLPDDLAPDGAARGLGSGACEHHGHRKGTAFPSGVIITPGILISASGLGWCRPITEKLIISGNTGFGKAV